MNTEIYHFSKLLKEIRNEAGLTQKKLADKLGVSKVLVGMLESNMKEPSKKFVGSLASLLKVHPSVLMPFVTIDENEDYDSLSKLEKKLITLGVKLQNELIKNKSKKISQ